MRRARLFESATKKLGLELAQLGRRGRAELIAEAFAERFVDTQRFGSVAPRDE
jgi:hypothetical protein